MPYRYVTEKEDYSHYASGHVLYGAPGHPSFPVRLASEIFQGCLAYCANGHSKSRYVVYDPVCGSAYHLTVLAYLHWESIRSVICSDIDKEILTTALNNLGLLSLEGMDRRIDELNILAEMWGKGSHAYALESATYLRQRLVNSLAGFQIQTTVFHADALDSQILINNLGVHAVDIVFADVPYGKHSNWQLTNQVNVNPISILLTNLQPLLVKNGIVAVAADKQSKVVHPFYNRVDRFQVGKRRVTLLSPIC